MPRSSCALLALGFIASPLFAQAQILLPSPMLPPCIAQNGQTIAFGSSVEPDGTRDSAWDIWLWTAKDAPFFSGGTLQRLTNYAAANQSFGASALDLSKDGSEVAYVYSPNGSSTNIEIHLIDTATGTDHLLTTYTQGCIVPEAICAGCFYSCVRQARVIPAGGVLYDTVGSQPFYVVATNGIVTDLPYSGNLSYGPQPVMSDAGVLVFTSDAPSGVYLAAAATNVYTTNLDGSSLRNVTQFSNPNVIAANASISADGNFIVFQANYDLPSGTVIGDSNVFIIRSDGSNLRQLSTGTLPANSPSVSADGSVVAWVQSGQVMVANANGAAPAAPATSFTYSVAADPVISDDGSQVAFDIAPSYGTRGAIYSVPAGGGTAVAVYAPVSVNPDGVIGIAGFVPPSPGSLFSVYGLNFVGDQLLGAAGFPLPTSLGGVSLLVNGQAVPLSSVSPWQINAQLPQNFAVGNATFQVSYGGGATSVSNTASTPVQATGPAVFTFLWQGYAQAAAFHGDTNVFADAAHPVAAGEVIATYGTGLGLTNPPVAAGAPAPGSPLAYAVAPQVTIGTVPAIVTFAGLVPGLASVYQINLQIPQGLASGPQTLAWGPQGAGTIFVQ